MSRDQHRFTGYLGSTPSPDYCAAAVPQPRIGFHQCGNKPKKGTEWCAIHTIIKVAEDAPELWIVETGWGIEGPKLVSAKIVKETKRQICLEKSVGAWDWQEKIRKTAEGAPYKGFRTRFEAVEDHAHEMARELKRAQRAAKKAEASKMAADKLLLKISNES